ncbi:MAG: right-handed parallel beta-helix repeat-containing protein [archaeon]|nr:right-handed parallel beta-helix repeat-containing protein [archaeon]MCP8314639.1 right-handed parallel beta-helix repeat-containing protein [archaeon]
MKKFIGTIVIAMLLMTPLLLMIPVQVIAQPTMKLSDAVGGGTGGTFYLNPSILYTGGVTISGDTRIYGQDAMMDLQGAKIEIVNTYLYIERCTITRGTSLPGNGALEFEDGASGFVYNNIIAGNQDNGIEIRDSSDIIIKENSIIYNGIVGSGGIYFEDSTDITILENIIKNNGAGIIGDNGDLYDEDPNLLQNIKIKGNDIGLNDEVNIYLKNVTGVSIASNFIYSAETGIVLEYCPIVSITYNKILTNEEVGIYYGGGEDWPDITTSTGAHTVELSLTISYNKIIRNGIDADTGIYAVNTQNVVITYNEIIGNGPGIYLKGYDEDFLMMPILIAYNTIIGNADGGIFLEDYVSDVSILFNKIMGNEMVGIYAKAQNGGDGDYGENLLIKGNVINYNVGEAAIYIEYWDAPVVIEWNTILSSGVVYVRECENPQIIYNTIMYEIEVGLYLENCEGGRIAHNTMAYNIGFNLGIKGSNDVIVEYNTMIGASVGAGIYVDDCDDMTIQYNNIHNNQVGIYWRDSSGLIANNIIGHTDGNLISGQLLGINIFDSLSGVEGLTTISDNKIIGNGVGIHCSSSDPTIIRNYISNNLYGIMLIGNSDSIIGGTYDNRNYIIRNYADGIYISSDDSDPIINYNNIYENVGYGVYSVPQAVTDINAENNWWGAIDGPGNPLTFGEGPGSGDEVSDYVDYIPWLFSEIP